MSDPYLTIVSDGGSVRSDEIATNGSGVEVKAGVTGFGLPPVDLQFDDSAGDGSRYRGRRVQQRTLDLHFQVYGPDRDSLKPHLDRLSQVLAYPCTITLVDDDAGESWRVLAYRSGGGDYSYGDGEDDDSTDGYTYVRMSVTMLTESPYWESANVVTRNIAGAGTLSITNPGTAPAPPKWIVRGPTNGFKATNENGESIWFSALLDSDTTLEIDCATGTVTDSKGQNRYNDLTDLPRFWQLPEGSSNVTISYDRSSSAYEVIYGAPRHNFVKNPRFQTGTTNWALTGFTYDGTERRVNQNNADGFRPVISTTISGLTVGQNYVVRFVGDISRATPWPTGSTTLPSRLVIEDGQVKKPRVYTEKEITPFGTTGTPLTFTAENTTVTLKFYPLCAEKKDGTYARSDGWVDMFYLGEPGYFFDGASIDTAGMQYDWTGDADNSVSTATPLSIPTGGGGPTNPIVSVEFRPRKWLVI